MPRDEAYSRAKLERFLPVLYSAAAAGVRSVFDEYPATGHIHSKNTRRRIARDHIVDNLRADLMVDPDVSIRDRNQTTYFDICGEYRLLAKMANGAGMVALNRNQTSFEFQHNRQAEIFASSEMPGRTNLYLSYVPNAVDPKEPFVYLICPKEDGYHWRIELEPPAASLAGEIAGTPPPSDDLGTDLVRIPQEKKPDTSE
ncbi:hypothetical protein [Mesorhizobium sp. M0058]|uniref:hypothetical protein n=1 Tax=Mesorhizobium sp. M0058 TaxID=2956865 RepID=UPI00333D8AB3